MISLSFDDISNAIFENGISENIHFSMTLKRSQPSEKIVENFFWK
jgi:phage protein U